MRETATILDIPVNPYTMDEAVSKLTGDTLSQKINFVVTAKAEIIMMAQQDAAYKKLLQEETDMILPDGAGTVWAGNYLGYHIPERVAGYDLFLRLLEEAAKRKIPVFFFGGKPGVAEEAAEEGRRRWPGLQVAGCRNGYFSADEETAIINEINGSGAAMLFAALGAPKQEKWLNHYAAELKPCLRMGIGGSFDVLAGKMQRAPKWMQDAKLEWLFRLMKQPSRIGRMMALPKFVLEVRKEKRKNNR